MERLSDCRSIANLYMPFFSSAVSGYTLNLMSFADSRLFLYGLMSMKIMNAVTRTAAIRPGILILPVKAEAD